MPATEFENRVNVARGYSCLLITVTSLWLVLSKPRCLLFWWSDGYQLVVERTGMLGFVTSVFFLLYLLVDTIVGFLCHDHFRRSSRMLS